MNKTISVANICLVDDNNNILLLERSRNINRAGFWGFPGGVIDDGENAQTAAIRELREETGIQESDIELIKFQKFLITKPIENVKITAYLGKILSNVKIELDSFEHTDYKWISLNGLIESKDLMPGIPTILKSLLELEDLIDLTVIKPNKIQLIDN